MYFQFVIDLILEVKGRVAADVPTLALETVNSLANPDDYFQPGQTALLEADGELEGRVARQVSTRNKLPPSTPWFVCDTVTGVARIDDVPGMKSNPHEFVLSLGDQAYVVPGRGQRKFVVVLTR